MSGESRKYIVLNVDRSPVREIHSNAKIAINQFRVNSAEREEAKKFIAGALLFRSMGNGLGAIATGALGFIGERYLLGYNTLESLNPFNISTGDTITNVLGGDALALAFGFLTLKQLNRGLRYGAAGLDILRKP